MRLAKLKLAGFKTFVDPTTVLTPGNLVGVVGPNGCGKSNIIDAVRWVLGESRASALRGGSMMDVIFNGSTTRKPVSRASVELVFDNAEGKAAGQWKPYAEVAVKRVLDRSGESTYFINGTQVRRKDVIDLFLGTGLGPRAYAIIEQGMISRIIEAKPEEVRGFLEEAAGVTKYRERRKETEGRLSDARDNLTRLDDIRNELGQQIGKLEAQAAVAEKYRQLNASLSERQNLLWLLKCYEARAEKARLSGELADATRRIEADSSRLQELEAQLEEARESQLQANEGVQLAQSALFAVSSELTRLEGELARLRDSRRILESRLAQLERDDAQWRSQLDSLAGESERWQGLLEHAALRAEQAEARHMEVSERLPEAEEALRGADATAAAVRRELNQAEQQIRVEDTHRQSSERSLEALAQRRARLLQEQAAVQAPDLRLVAEREAALNELEECLERAQGEIGDAGARLPHAQLALKQAVDAERHAQKRATELRARREALVQLQNKVQVQGQLGDWLRRHHLEGLKPLWQRLKVEAGWELALEAVLRERLGALPAADGQAALAALADRVPGAITFLLPVLPEPVMPCPAPEGTRALLDLVQPEAGLEAVLEAWLARVFVADELASWVDRRDSLPAGCLLVSREGRLLDRHALSHYAPDARTHGVIERQREIEQLTAEVEAAQDEAALARDAVGEAEALATRLQDSLASLRRDAQGLQARVHAEQVEVLKLNQARIRYEERCGQVDRDLGEIAHGEEAERDRLMRAETELERSRELAELQRGRLDAAEAVRQERESALRETRALDQALGRELQEARHSERECASKLEDISRNRTLAGEQLQRIAEELQERRESLMEIDEASVSARLQETVALRGEREAALAESRNLLEGVNGRLRALEDDRQRTEHAAAPQRERVADLRLRVQAADMAEGQHAARLEEAQADEVALLPLLTPDLKEGSLQREVARLGREIAELGPVNLAALDELKSAVERKTYLDTQTEDLLGAIDTLEDAIRRIDRETREQLQETYNTVNRHFGSLFPMLFGGGEARLVLTGDEILDAGITIVAQPPGKKNSSIQLLSGGEKALTAIALVFSMFQLNPAPFCMLDEVDAPLDDSNTERYCQMVKRMSSQTQFVFISHSKITMEIAQQLVGVTMQEQGVSRVVEVDIEEALRLAESVAA
ncbi:chromosome segregation protein SMC [Zoogloea dura]|uniref:Chromosome partition protein Smc n=1 Tax=Zoogloea dura TaxID=2728840 RepID=A0A848FZM2_9RHOO|nr:chromosome segregation protein SMC [Zoogloea dura]NML25377.1 chromosome segregation protein SMC [Zoogloea dura]